MSELLQAPGSESDRPARGRAMASLPAISIVIGCLVLVVYLLLTLLPLLLALFVGGAALLVIVCTALWIWLKESHRI